MWPEISDFWLLTRTLCILVMFSRSALKWGRRGQRRHVRGRRSEYRVRYSRTTGASLLMTPTFSDLCQGSSELSYGFGRIKPSRTGFLSSLLISFVEEGGSTLPCAEICSANRPCSSRSLEVLAYYPNRRHRRHSAELQTAMGVAGSLSLIKHIPVSSHRLLS